MEISELCKCLKCNTILIDENPQVNANQYNIPLEAKEMIFLRDEEDNIGYWACPNCRTDGYLVDL